MRCVTPYGVTHFLFGVANCRRVAQNGWKRVPLSGTNAPPAIRPFTAADLPGMRRQTPRARRWRSDVHILQRSATHKCGVSSGSVYCWGKNSSGALGIGSIDANAHDAPEKVAGPVAFVAVQAGENRTCALGADQRIYCWGNGYSATGDDAPSTCGFETYCVASPKLVTGGGTYTDFRLAPFASMCGLTESGAMDCWNAFNLPPSRVQSTRTFVQPGVWCAVTETDGLYCWSAGRAAARFPG